MGCDKKNIIFLIAYTIFMFMQQTINR